MSKFKRADLTKIKTISIKKRKSKVTPADFAKVFDGKKGSFAAFEESLPRILAAEDLRTLVDDIVKSRKKDKPVILMMGAHVIKVGLSPVLIDLIKRNVITAVGCGGRLRKTLPSTSSMAASGWRGKPVS
ncbi:MAG: hypothetical protein HW412_2654 [Bacteroidetes bacterium]|nr:hypothetical protein [Bacteroidota bacterium]